MLGSMKTVDRRIRKSLPLTARDLLDLEIMRRSVAHREALTELSREELDESSSEAAVIHAVWEAGMKAVAEQVEEAGYSQIAADMDVASRKKVARRRAPSWADE
jgi:hypothetical protein